MFVLCWFVQEEGWRCGFLSESENWLALALVLILAFVAFAFLLTPPEYVLVAEKGVSVTKTTTMVCTVVDGDKDCEVVNKTREMEEWQWGNQTR